MSSISLKPDIAFKGAEHKPKKVKNSSKGNLAAYGAATGVGLLYTKVIDKAVYNNFLKISQTTPQENAIFKNAFLKAFENSGLKKKGAEIVDVAVKSVTDTRKPITILKENLKETNGDIVKALKKMELIHPKNKRAFLEYERIITNGMTRAGKAVEQSKVKYANSVLENSLGLKSGTLSKMPKVQKMIKRYLYSFDFNQMQEGKGALAFLDNKKLFLPLEKLSMSGFHEMGHLKFHSTKFGKLLPKMGPVAYLSFLISAAAILGRTKKETNGKKLNLWDKSVNFVRNNAAKLMFLTGLPVLINEGMASVYGQKMAKGVLKPEMYKKLTKMNTAAFGTYLARTLVPVATVFLAVKAKDYFQNRHEAKVKAHNESLKAS